MRRRLVLAALLLLGAAPLARAGDTVVLASTTSVENSGLLAHILPAFSKETGIDVRVLALGTGQALAVTARGDADLLLVHGQSWGADRVVGASLDHAMWFHRPFRADEWWLYDQSSPWTGGNRGLARGEIWTREGELVASVVQEGLLRRARR